jgi:anti-sigma regulatory factor (Ser/Thr protein kinase)
MVSPNRLVRTDEHSMASLPFQPGQSGTAPGDVKTGTRVGQVFLDVRQRSLTFLDPVAKQLHKDGVAFTPSDLETRQLHTLTGEAVTPGELPLVVAWRERRPAEATFVVTSPRGVDLRVSWHAAPVRGAGGEVIGIAGTVQCAPPDPDWQAMAGLAHDLRTPLNAITLQLAVLQHMAASNPDLSKVLTGLQSSADRALRVGLDLLTWCRQPGQKGRGVESTWFPLEPLLADLGREQGLASKNKGLVLHCDFTSCGGWEVYSDRIRLGRILSNLLVNAVRYTPRGRIEFTTSWRDDAHGRVLAVGVVDTGEGFTPEEQDSIFQPFERGKAGKEGDSGGSGLGLAVVDRLVDELGVELDVYSEHGRGSTFHLLIPSSLLRQASPDGTGQKAPAKTNSVAT